MADLARLVVYSSGWTGGPGYTTFCSLASEATDLQTHVLAFYNALKSAVLSNQITYAVPNTGDTFDSATGNLVGTWTAGTATSVQGTGTGGVSAVSGAVCSWGTSTIVGTRRLRGRTFLVPLDAIAYAADGELNGSAHAAILAAAQNLYSFGLAGLNIWHRPTTTGGSDGAAASVTSVKVPFTVANLRSRKA